MATRSRSVKDLTKVKDGSAVNYKGRLLSGEGSTPIASEVVIKKKIVGGKIDISKK